MREFKFNVFGRHVAIVDAGSGWEAFLLGNEGKRRPADFSVPHHVDADDLAEYLADLFHEAATPTNPGVNPIP